MSKTELTWRRKRVVTDGKSMIHDVIIAGGRFAGRRRDRWSSSGSTSGATKCLGGQVS